MKVLTSGSPRSSDVCPHCGQRMLIRHGVHLSPRLADIFDIIEHSGDRGVTEEVLSSIFYSGKSSREAYNCIRVNISHINSHFASTDYKVEREFGRRTIRPGQIRVAKAVGVKGSEYPYRVLKEDQAAQVRDGEGAVRELSEPTPPWED